MVDPPFFLRECDKFPSPPLEPPPERAFEIVLNEEEDLLSIKDAAELLLGFLWNDDRHHHRHHDCKGQRRGHRDIIWLSEDVYITDRRDGVYPLHAFKVKLDGQLFKDDEAADDDDDDDDDNHYLNICQEVPLQMPPERERNYIRYLAWGRLTSATDTCLRLLAQHKTITHIRIEQKEDEPFYPSDEALQFFVGNAQQSPRELCFVGVDFTSYQWGVVTSHCNNNVKISYKTHVHNYTTDKFLEEVVKRNHQRPPANQQLLVVGSIDIRCKYHGTSLQTLVSALESMTCSLQSLKLNRPWWEQDCPTVMSLCAAIARNQQGLQRLELSRDEDSCFRGDGLALSATEWEFVCYSLASHPTLKTLHLDVLLAKSSLSQQRDQLFVQHVVRNSVLCKFTSSSKCFYNYDLVNQTVRPCLELNRFRPLVEAIKHETDTARRRALFTCALRSDVVSNWPVCRFWLVKENFDLLAS